MKKKHMTVTETLASYPLGRTKLYELLASNQIRGRKLGRKTLVLADSIEEYFATLPEYQSTGGK